MFATELDIHPDDSLAARDPIDGQNMAAALLAIGHDVRQPLVALRLLTESYAGKRLDRDTLRYIEGVRSCLTAMDGALSGVLDLCRLTCGKSGREVIAFPLAPFFAEVEATYSILAERKGLSFKLVYSALDVASDPVLLRRIVGNLLSNALQYTSSGGVLLGCRRAGAAIEIQVWDTGVGIDPRELSQIFAPMRRGKFTRPMAADGLGLGLANVKGLAALLGHPLRVASTPGKGSMFSIKVPIAL